MSNTLHHSVAVTMLSAALALPWSDTPGLIMQRQFHLHFVPVYNLLGKLAQVVMSCAWGAHCIYGSALSTTAMLEHVSV